MPFHFSSIKIVFQAVLSSDFKRIKSNSISINQFPFFEYKNEISKYLFKGFRIVLSKAGNDFKIRLLLIDQPLHFNINLAGVL